MKVFINGTLYDSEKECIALVFDNDDQRRLVAGHLTNMLDRDDDKPRVYASYPGELAPGEFDNICHAIDAAVTEADVKKCGRLTNSCPRYGARCAECPDRK